MHFHSRFRSLFSRQQKVSLHYTVLTETTKAVCGWALNNWPMKNSLKATTLVLMCGFQNVFRPLIFHNVRPMPTRAWSFAENTVGGTVLNLVIHQNSYKGKKTVPIINNISLNKSFMRFCNANLAGQQSRKRPFVARTHTHTHARTHTSVLIQLCRQLET